MKRAALLALLLVVDAEPVDAQTPRPEVVIRRTSTGAPVPVRKVAGQAKLPIRKT